MFKVTAPATSANLSVGFDTLGLALDLYNTFLFEEDNEFSFVGFSKEESTEENLIVKAYRSFLKQYGNLKDLQKVKITLEEQEIPISRGLGSSATCILAGVFAANHVHNLHVSFDECVAFAARFEGHSDNVFACAYGSLCGSVKLEDGYYHERFSVDETYLFHVLIPSSKGSTKELRNVLPKEVDYQDAIHNLSRMVFVPTLFEQENFKVLREVLTDQLHEQYRYPFIPMDKQIKELSKEKDLIICISGSGPSILTISISDTTNKLHSFKNTYEVKEVHVSNGIEMEVIK